MKDKNDNKEIVLYQWQTCVEMANSVSNRRDSMNNLFVTINLALIAAVSLIWDIKTLVLLVAGVVGCIVWAIFIKNYGKLNSAKFKVISELEKHLPTQPFSDEWNTVKQKKYINSTNLELILPIVFLVLYVMLFHLLIKCK